MVIAGSEPILKHLGSLLLTAQLAVTQQRIDCGEQTSMPWLRTSVQLLYMLELFRVSKEVGVVSLKRKNELCTIINKVLEALLAESDRLHPDGFEKTKLCIKVTIKVKYFW